MGYFLNFPVLVLKILFLTKKLVRPGVKMIGFCQCFVISKKRLKKLKWCLNIDAIFYWANKKVASINETT